MSEASFVVMIKDNFENNYKKLTLFMKKYSDQGVIYKYNQEWLIALLSEFPYQFDNFSTSISSNFKTMVVPFYESEDYGWGFKFYLEGKESFSIDLDFNDEVTSNNNQEGFRLEGSLDLLNELFLEKESNFVKELTNIQHPINDDKKIELLTSFKNSLEINQLHNIRYDNFSPDNHQSPIIQFGKVEKRINVKKILFETLEGRLKELGFLYVKDSPQSADFSFLRNDNGYWSGVDIFIDGYNIVFQLSTNYRDYYVNQLDGFKELFEEQYRSFNSASHLKYILKRFIEIFEDYGLEIIKRNMFIPFDINEITDEILSHYLMDCNKANIIEPLNLGGEINYSNKSYQIKFRFHMLATAFSIDITKGNTEKNIYDVLNLDKIWVNFRNKEEYSYELKRILELLICNNHLG